MILTKGQIYEISREIDYLERELFRLDGYSDNSSEMLRNEILDRYDNIILTLEKSLELCLKKEKLSKFRLILGGK